MAAIYIVKEARSSFALTQEQITAVRVRICKSVGDEWNTLLSLKNFAVAPDTDWKWKKQNEMKGKVEKGKSVHKTARGFSLCLWILSLWAAERGTISVVAVFAKTDECSSVCVNVHFKFVT